ncbi:hypothetical protein [Rugamonas sp. DEMB1]|uniref:hypothetical protein n=1 Tax=Rugamonas sp. DEMB1 TaxID=3039386 RepID=UPI002447C810|nr:hypothetical protein [Rugamonas sp. DEMB1]WGG52355.1 hypothetical protein QC826_09515 [Rugamonas sp. DEMB1]
MKSAHRFAPSAALIATLLALAGCATPQDEHRGHHPQSAAPAGGAKTGAHGEMPMMEMKRMCEMHANMMRGKTPEERQAMMAEHMKGDSAETMKKKMTMMDEKCK